MSTATTDFTTPPALPPPDPDPFRYGWRFVANTSGQTLQVPLTLEDVLHPQEGDFIVNTPIHDRLRGYLRDASMSRFVKRQDVVVISDCRVDWQSEYGWIHGPDYGFFSGVKKAWRETVGTFKVREFGAKCECVIELTSPTTRGNDYGAKKREYFLVGVPRYIIVDIPDETEPGEVELIAYKAGKKSFEPWLPDSKGRLHLDFADLWLGADGVDLILEDAAGKRVLDYAGLSQKNVEAESELTRALHARQAAEQRARELEAQLAKLKNQP